MDEVRLQSLRFEALGTYVDLACTQGVDLDLMRSSLDAKVMTLDEVASCYRPDSEVRKLYDLTLARRCDGEYEVSDVLWWLLSKAEEARQITSGLVDIALGGILADEYRLDGCSSSDARGLVELSGASHVVRLGRGTLIDLHSLGKAYWAERCAHELSMEFEADVLVGLGGDIFVSSLSGHTYFPIAIPKDGRSVYQEGDQLVYLSRGGIATSTKLSRQVRYCQGEIASHIFDPRTLRPSSHGADVATVVGRSTGMCNVLSLMSLIDGQLANEAIDNLAYHARLVVGDSVTFVGDFGSEVLEV